MSLHSASSFPDPMFTDTNVPIAPTNVPMVPTVPTLDGSQMSIETRMLHETLRGMTETQNATNNALAIHAQLLDTIGQSLAQVRGPAPKKIPLSTPQPYDGTPEKYDAYITTLRIAFEADPITYATVNARIMLALSLLMKHNFTAIWAQRFLEEKSAGRYVVTTWDIFEERLRKTFCNINRELEARNKLSTLRQGNKSAEDFFIVFKEYYLCSGFNDATAIHLLQNGAVNESIISRIMLSGEAPPTLQDWEDRIVMLDRQSRINRERLAGMGHTPWSSFNSNNPFAKRAAHSFPTPALSTPSTSTDYASSNVLPTASTPMQVDAITNAPPLSSVKCFNCNQLGHYASSCKLPNRRAGQVLGLPTVPGTGTAVEKMGVRRLTAGRGRAGIAFQLVADGTGRLIDGRVRPSVGRHTVRTTEALVRTTTTSLLPLLLRQGYRHTTPNDEL